MKQIEVHIMDQSYLLGCPEGGEAQLREAVERVDSAMCRIRDAGKVRARDRIAVLASLNLAFDLGVQMATAAEAAEALAAAAPAAAAAAGEPGLPSASSGTGSDLDSSADAARVADLIRRLDQALAGDGHLL